EIINLTRYTYLDSSTLDLETNIDRLRKLISLYLATNVEIISEYTSFIVLIKGGGAVVQDLLKRVRLLPKELVREMTRLDG
ncbi:hypothetical protein BJ875DRAFT_390272, partial [Amylocarpus encephaloides]